MSEDNSVIVRRFIQPFVNERNDDALEALVADNFVCHVPGNLARGAGGREAWRRRAEALWTAFPDFHVTIDDLIAADDKVVLRYHAAGTHRGPIFGVDATNLPMSCTGIMIMCVSDGKIVEEWAEATIVSAVQQLAAQAKT